MSEVLTMRWSAELQTGLHDWCIAVNELHKGETPVVCLEVGCYAGDGTDILLQHFEYVISIDPYVDGYDMEDGAAIQGNLHKVYRQAAQRFMYNVKHQLYRCDFAGFMRAHLHKHRYNPIAAVYIDGDHRYEAVKSDIENAQRINIPIIGGHDFSRESVNKAVIEMKGKSEIQTFADDSWLYTPKK